MNDERVLLPRIVDVVSDAMLMLRDLPAHAEPEMLVMDFADAFWHLPVHPRERKFLSTKVADRYFIFDRVPQGSRAGPLVWARFAAILMRASQAMLGSEAFLNCYVDDPLVLLGSNSISNRRNIALLILLWRACGPAVAFQKAQLGTTVTWTSAVLTLSRTSLRVAIKEALVQDILTLLGRCLSKNVVGVKLLKSLAGKLSHVTSMLPAIRPFVHPLWAALSTEGLHGAPS
eukprot:3917092-Amphidinium_carterae.1